jgi:GNAT superfamily N-acetyltransferase
MHPQHRATIAADRRSRSRAQADQRRIAPPQSSVLFRPIHITDVERLDRMFRRFSPESVRMRFFSSLPSVPRSALLRLAVVDHQRDEAIVALDGNEIVGVAGYNGLQSAAHEGMRDAEVAVAVEDAWQRRGLGRLLTRHLAGVARERGCDAFRIRILPDNRPALRFLRDLVPDASVRFDGGEYAALLPLHRSQEMNLCETTPVVTPSR